MVNVETVEANHPAWRRRARIVAKLPTWGRPKLCRQRILTGRLIARLIQLLWWGLVSRDGGKQAGARRTGMDGAAEVVGAAMEHA